MLSPWKARGLFTVEAKAFQHGWYHLFFCEHVSAEVGWW